MIHLCSNMRGTSFPHCPHSHCASSPLGFLLSLSSRSLHTDQSRFSWLPSLSLSSRSLHIDQCRFSWLLSLSLIPLASHRSVSFLLASFSLSLLPLASHRPQSSFWLPSLSLSRPAHFTQIRVVLLASFSFSLSSRSLHTDQSRPFGFLLFLSLVPLASQRSELASFSLSLSSRSLHTD